MKKLLALVAAVAAGTVLADDDLVTDPVTVTFVPPHVEETALVNSTANATTIYDETAYPITEENLLSFAGFEAAVGSTSLFKGGFWRFGTSAFLLPTAADRTVVFGNGAVVGNVGDLTLGGASGLNGNRLVLSGTSDVSVAKCILGTANLANQDNEVWITDGARLTCTDYISFSDVNVNNSTLLSGNRIVVSNANSRLVARATTYMDHKLSGYCGGTGGGHLIVTDGGRADLQTLCIATSGAHSQGNRVTVSKGGFLTMTQLNLGTDWYSVFKDDQTLFEVLDGGVVTNTGAIYWGYGNKNHGGSTLFVSNATFVAKEAPGGKPRMNVPNCTIRVAGEKTVFRLSDTYSYDPPLFPNMIGGNTVILEDKVSCSLPIHRGFSYTGVSTNCTVIVRTGACLNQGVSADCNVMMAGYNRGNGPKGLCNRIFVESCATVNCWQVYANSVNGFFGISNATVNCACDWYHNEHAGFYLGATKYGNGSNIALDYGRGTNMVLAISGTSPKLTTANSRMIVDASSTIRFDLPREGYDAPSSPRIRVGTELQFYTDTDCRIVFTGAEEMMAYHTDVLKCRRRYLLVDASSFLNVDTVAAAAQATLPEGMTLEIVTATGTNRKQLWLDVHPKFGMMLLVR